MKNVIRKEDVVAMVEMLDPFLESLIKDNLDRKKKKLVKLFSNDGLFKKVFNLLDEDTLNKIIPQMLKYAPQDICDRIGARIAEEKFVEDNDKLEEEKKKLQEDINYYKNQADDFKQKLKLSNHNNMESINQLDNINSKYLTDKKKWDKEKNELTDKVKDYNKTKNRTEMLKNYKNRLDRNNKDLVEKIKLYEKEKTTQEKEYNLIVVGLKKQLEEDCKKQIKKEKQYNLVVKGLEDEIAKQRKSEKASKKDYKLDVDIDFDGYKPKHAKKEPIQKVTDNYVPKHALKENIEKKVDSIDDKVSDEPCVITVIEKNTYYNRMSRHGKSLRNSNLQQIAEILSGDYVRENGKRAWTWEQRENEIKKLYANNDIKYNEEEKQDIEEMIFITESNKYATNKHKRKLNNIYTTLRAPTESKIKGFFKRNWKKVVAGGLIAATVIWAYFGVKAYNNNKVEPFAKGVESKVEYISEDKINKPITVETLVNIDDYDVKENEKIVSKETVNKPVVYEVKKGDCLWNIAKGYIKEQGVRPTNKLICDVTNIIAVENGKAKLGVYKGLEKKDKENPNLIYPKEEIKISEKIKNYIQEYKQKGDGN